MGAFWRQVRAQAVSSSIGDFVYIGSQALLPGTSIGSRSVIAANSFVNDDVLEATIAGGTPASRLARSSVRVRIPYGFRFGNQSDLLTP